MKKFKKMLVTGMVVVGLGASVYSVSPASARGNGGWGPGNGGQFAQQGAVIRDEMIQARLEIITEMTGQPKDEIEAKMRHKPLWSLLEEYKVDYKLFSEKILDKQKGVINQAAADGKISEEQQKWMLLRVEQMGTGGPRFHRGNRGGQRGGMGPGSRGKRFGGQRGYWGNSQNQTPDSPEVSN